MLLTATHNESEEQMHASPPKGHRRKYSQDMQSILCQVTACQADAPERCIPNTGSNLERSNELPRSQSPEASQHQKQASLSRSPSPTVYFSTWHRQLNQASPPGDAAFPADPTCLPAARRTTDPKNTDKEPGSRKHKFLILPVLVPQDVPFGSLSRRGEARDHVQRESVAPNEEENDDDDGRSQTSSTAFSMSDREDHEEMA